MNGISVYSEKMPQCNITFSDEITNMILTMELQLNSQISYVLMLQGLVLVFGQYGSV